MYTYIYIYRERERERETLQDLAQPAGWPSGPLVALRALSSPSRRVIGPRGAGYTIYDTIIVY